MEDEFLSDNTFDEVLSELFPDPDDDIIEDYFEDRMELIYQAL